jgi:peptide/nickel transport system permease protein
MTLFLASIIVFLATEVLPGNAAFAVLGNSATPQRLHAVEQQLNLDSGIVHQYWTWLSGILSGDPGQSLVTGESVTSQVGPEIRNSAALVIGAGLISTVLGIAAGTIAALRRDRAFDHVTSVVALGVTALPEFVVAIGLIIVFSTLVFHALPAVSLIEPGVSIWSDPEILVLPIATLVIVVLPYLFRMTRAVVIEALESEYVEMAELKGVPPRRIVLRHALPNAIAPMVQVVGLNLLYLAGGIVVVEFVFNFNGMGRGLVEAVNARDIPVIQFIVIVLAAFYIMVNILSDVIALLASPRRRLPR